MRIHNPKRNHRGRRIVALLLLCGLLMPILPQTEAATVTYEYTWVQDAAGLPTDNQWHDYFIAWEDFDDKNKFWFTDYHWFTAEGDSNIDEGGTHWMEYKAASTLPNITAASFTSRDCLGHMQIKFAGIDRDNDNSPQYYIRVSKMHGGYSYFTSYEPSEKESSADAFTFQDKGDVFHIFFNATAKADRYLTRDGQYLETTESSSYGGGEYYRPLRVYKRTFTVDESEIGTMENAIGKVTLYDCSWVNTVDELLALAETKEWMDIFLAWEDCNGADTNNPDKVWYTKEVWYDEEEPNYQNGANNEFYYWSNDILGSDGYSSPYAERFLLPSEVGHFQIKCVGWDSDNPVDGYTTPEGKSQKSPVFNIRFDIGRGQYIYIGNNAFSEKADDAEDYTIQLRLGRTREEDLYGSVWIINNITAAQDELFTRKNNRFDISNWIPSKYWEFPFRVYAYQGVEYDAIVKSFTVGKGATYSIDTDLIIDEGVTITVEDGGVLTVDKQLLNNGQILVKNGGTVIVNEGGYIMSYDQEAEGKITLDGGNMIIMEGAKVICDKSGGILQVGKGSTIVNRGMLMIGEALVMNQSSYLKNETTGILAVGGKIGRERGAVGSLSPAELLSRISNGSFTLLCSTNSKLHNYGTISAPRSDSTPWTSGESRGILNKGKLQGR